MVHARRPRKETPEPDHGGDHRARTRRRSRLRDPSTGGLDQRGERQHHPGGSRQGREQTEQRRPPPALGAEAEEHAHRERHHERLGVAEHEHVHLREERAQPDRPAREHGVAGLPHHDPVQERPEGERCDVRDDEQADLVVPREQGAGPASEQRVQGEEPHVSERGALVAELRDLAVVPRVPGEQTVGERRRTGAAPDLVEGVPRQCERADDDDAGDEPRSDRGRDVLCDEAPERRSQRLNRTTPMCSKMPASACDEALPGPRPREVGQDRLALHGRRAGTPSTRRTRSFPCLPARAASGRTQPGRPHRPCRRSPPSRPAAASSTSGTCTAGRRASADQTRYRRAELIRAVHDDVAGLRALRDRGGDPAGLGAFGLDRPPSRREPEHDGEASTADPEPGVREHGDPERRDHHHEREHHRRIPHLIRGTRDVRETETHRQRRAPTSATQRTAAVGRAVRRPSRRGRATRTRAPRRRTAQARRAAADRRRVAHRRTGSSWRRRSRARSWRWPTASPCAGAARAGSGPTGRKQAPHRRRGRRAPCGAAGRRRPTGPASRRHEDRAHDGEQEQRPVVGVEQRSGHPATRPSGRSRDARALAAPPGIRAGPVR